jgi:hypothetical protein
LADLGFKVFVENLEVLVLMVPRESKGQKVFLDTKVHLVS